MGSSSKGKQPEEVKERMKQQQIENQAEQINIGQITAMLEKACKLYVKSKTNQGVPEELAIQWVITGQINVLADLCAYSFSKGYVKSLEDLVIASAEQIHNVAEKILLAHQEPEKKIIIPGPEDGN